MKILNFDEFVNEGLWAKGIERSKTGEERIENTNPQFEKYLESIEWMDMGLKDKLYAKFDFNEGMSINQIKNLKLPEGVEIMSGVNFYMLKGLCDISKNSTTVDEVDVKVFSVFNPRNKDKIYFNLNTDLQYFTDIEKDDINVINMFGIRTVKKSKVDFDCPEYIFKLVKTKTVNEGLWAKGIERSKTGEERLGEKKIHVSSRDELIDVLGDLIKERGVNADLTDVDVSKVTDMHNLFTFYPDVKRINISNWDVSNVENMEDMFYLCSRLDCDLSNWNVSKVKDTSHMFWGCTDFNSDLSKWDVSNVENMKGMFGMTKINCDLSNWNVSNVKDMSNMFYNCVDFSYDLSKWDVSNVEKIGGIFTECYTLKKKNKFPKWYLEYIKTYEGLWAKGIERSKTGEERLGDVTDFDRYIKTINWVDMGHPKYLFAEMDFEERGLSINEVEEITKKLPKGVEIMNSDMYTDHLRANIDIHKRSKTVDNKKQKDVVYEHVNGNKITFSIIGDLEYITDFKIFEDDDIYSIDTIFFSLNRVSTYTYSFQSYSNFPEYMFKLVKLK